MKVWFYLLVNWLAIVLIFMLFILFGVLISIMAANQIDAFEESSAGMLLFIFIVVPFGFGGAMASCMYFDWSIGLEGNSPRYKKVRGEL